MSIVIFRNDFFNFDQPICSNLGFLHQIIPVSIIVPTFIFD